MGSPFRSFASKPVKVSFTDEQVLNAARELLDEHEASREAATLEVNQVCGACKGSGVTASTLMVGESMKCYACEGSGKPNATVQSLPQLTQEDHLRIWKLTRLVESYPKCRPALLALIKERFPDMYRDGSEKAAN